MYVGNETRNYLLSQISDSDIFIPSLDHPKCYISHDEFERFIQSLKHLSLSW